MFAAKTGMRSAARSFRSVASKRFESTSSSKVPSAKGSFLGFFAGATLTGIGCYYYIMEEYKSTSNAVVSDVLKLQNAVAELDKHVTDIEIELAHKGTK